MQIDIGGRKIDTGEVVEAFIDTQEIKLKNGELIHLMVCGVKDWYWAYVEGGDSDGRSE